VDELKALFLKGRGEIDDNIWQELIRDVDTNKDGEVL
jgi:hypothetical protein